MTRHHKDWLTAYMEYTQHLESPDRLHFWTGVFTIAGALRRKVWIDEIFFHWVPNFYLYLVGPPGIVAKSTTVSVGMSLLKKVKGVKFGPASVTWQSLIERLMESRIDFKLPGGEFMPMSALTIAAKELGTFLDPNNREMIDNLVDWWDCRLESWERSTRMHGVETILNPWVSIIAATTPSWVADNFKQSFLGGGFASRGIYVYADTKRRHTAYLSQTIPPGQKHLEKLLVEDLQQIASICGAFQLTPEARKWGTTWYETLQKESADKFENERISGYLARKQTHLHKVALIISASHKDDLWIDVEDLQRAEALLAECEADIPKVFGQMGREIAQQHLGALWSSIQEVGKIYEKDLYGKVFRLMRYGTFEETIHSMMKADLIERWVGTDGRHYLTAKLPSERGQPTNEDTTSPGEDVDGP